jgi:hypothetical protein
VLTAGDPSTLVDLARNWHATVSTSSGLPMLAAVAPLEVATHCRSPAAVPQHTQLLSWLPST